MTAEVKTVLLVDDESANIRIPVIFLTGRTDIDDETKGFEVGTVNYIHKLFLPAVVKLSVGSRKTSRFWLFNSMTDVPICYKQADSSPIDLAAGTQHSNHTRA